MRLSATQAPIATALMIFIRSEWHFYALRFVIGAMEAGFAPGILYYLTLWFPASLSYMWALLVMIIVLLVRPQGILGRRERVG